MECSHWMMLPPSPRLLPSPVNAGVHHRRLAMRMRAFWMETKRRRRRRLALPTPPRCQKMYVPGFGEASPEAKAAKNLQDFFNYVASYNPEAYDELMEFVGRNSLNDADSFCKKLMRESPRHKTLALRILEVRSAYAKRDFEWDNLKKLAFKMIDDANTKLMREYVLETSHIEDDKR